MTMTTEQKLREALELILPMAKGYAAEHPVGANSRYVLVAEEALSPEPPTSEEGAQTGTPLTDAFTNALYAESAGAAAQGDAPGVYGQERSPEESYGLAIDFARQLERTLQAKERELEEYRNPIKTEWF